MAIQDRIKYQKASDESPTIEEMTLIGEAVGEGYPGMLAVAEVLRNRAKYRGTTMEEEALKPKQFSFWNQGPQKAMKWAYNYENQFPDARRAIQEALSGSNTVGGADMYHADYVKPRWDYNKLQQKGKVGKHIFYREI